MVRPTGCKAEVINGFYMNMRSKFTAKDTSIHYYEASCLVERDVWIHSTSVAAPT